MKVSKNVRVYKNGMMISNRTDNNMNSVLQSFAYAMIRHYINPFHDSDNNVKTSVSFDVKEGIDKDYYVVKFNYELPSDKYIQTDTYYIMAEGDD